ncbi:ImmA/IrrE family metallo-endopeptidase [Pseudolysobacter antarcticus]|uniref:ImmA/IrrE family metallo-endopeptidase n=1 Tax=Pseudolysobacter antarcticus TaxID=2511995 RepID=A0A411HKS3_9GAMM|nr:ImmA/IrrE family metallo-endopeptidase [Pseudolysobacter antarcticus]QBB71014.1 ImmA/IrrE family metallo-endopeptidase [Pseudolysobacter antarcticus]
MSGRSKEWAKLPPDIQTLIESQQKLAPIKLSEIARLLGIEVRSATLPMGISGEIRPSVGNGKFTIKVNRHDDPKRQRFTVAHELAHFLLHREFIGNGLSDDVLYRSSLSDAKEAQANRLAADIIMPMHLIQVIQTRAHLAGVEDIVLTLAEALNVSTIAMQIRIDRA